MKCSLLKTSILLTSVIPLLLSGCGGSSNSSHSTEKALSYPYGADSFMVVTDENNDGIPEQTSETLFTYNDAMQVTAQTITTERYDADGKVTRKEIETSAFDPDIMPKPISSVPSAVFAAVDPMDPLRSNIAWGILLEYTEDTYYQNVETGELYQTPGRQRIYTYKYTSAGVLTEEGYFSKSESSYGGSSDSSESEQYSYSYNAADNLTQRSYLEEEDNNGDGSNDYRYTSTQTYTYDEHNNLTSSRSENTTDSNGDGTLEGENSSQNNYVNSYSDTELLESTQVTLNVGGSDEETYTITYTYNEAGLATAATYSRNTFNTNNLIDTFYSYSFSYDSAGRMLSNTMTMTKDTDAIPDGTMDTKTVNSYTWSYNSQGLMTASSEEYLYDSDLLSDGISDHTRRNHEYSYSDDGKNLTMIKDEHWNDSDLNGEFSDTDNHEPETVSITYDASGYFTESSELDESYSGGSLSSSYSYSQVLEYTAGQLTHTENRIENNDSASVRATNITYTDSSRLTSYITTIDDDNDNSIDYTEAMQLTYNEDNTVLLSFSSDKNEAMTMEEYMTMDIDFGSVDIPAGSYGQNMFGVETIIYPNVPGSSPVLTNRETIAEAKTYTLTVRFPKILQFTMQSGIAK